MLLPSLLGLVALLSCSSTPAPKPEPQRESVDPLIGVWGSETSFGPWIKGELIVDGRSSEWRARIAGFDVAARADDKGAVNFALPQQLGELRGHLQNGGKRLEGNWIQAAGRYPYNSRYASPVALAEVAPRVWRGTVSPLEHRISFYLQIDRSPGGALTAFIRNPEANLFRRRTWDVELKGGTVVLSNKDQRVEGKFDPKNQQLWLGVLDDLPPLVFSRRDRENAPGFYPRATSEYVYRAPLAEDDGWQVGSLSDAGLDQRPIFELVQKILTAPPSLSNPVNIHSLLIARHGKLVFEEYFYGYDASRAHDTRSAGKTWTSVLVGIAHDRNPKFGPDSPVYSVFKKYEPFANWSERKAKMQIRDLLNMTTGFYCDDSDDNAPGNEDNVQSQTQQPDWNKVTLDLPMASDPGGDLAVYCSMDTNLALGAVRELTGQWIPAFFNTHFAKPLQMTSYFMNLMPTGEAYGGGGLHLRPRDELKLGQLYLSGGVWNGRRVVSEQWVRDSLSLRAHFEQRMDIDVNHGYGYAWHTRPLQVGGRVIRDYYAGGNGGQLVIIVPDLDLVVGINGGDYGEGRKFFRWELEFVPQYILAAAVR